MYAPLNQEMVNDTAKLIMHRLIARLLVRDPLLIDRAIFRIGPLLWAGKNYFAYQRRNFAHS